jgi:NAD(P)-dependent dehydrogenase (short-subunit alcohol dehydrogenase family)
MKHAAPIMKALGGGAIINTASVSACQAGFGPHLYTAAKHAVLGLTRSVATELAAFGITVNALCPGGTLTQLAVDAAGGGAEGRRNAEVYLADLQPLKTVGLPEDMAQAALFLASPSARFMTGQALIVDGGATAGRPWNPGFEV